MPVHGAGPIDWAVQIAAIPRQRNAWPRCATLGDFASQIHSLGRSTGPPRGAGIAPTRQGAIGLAVRFDAKIKVTAPTSGYQQSLPVRTCVDWDAVAPFPPTLEQRQVLKFYVTRASKSPTAFEFGIPARDMRQPR